MFVQVIEGRPGNVEALRSQLDTWRSDLAPGADGWLGATGGVAADGTFISAVRFESEAAATANSERPEQGAWWEATVSAFDGDVTFSNCPEVDSFGAGGSDEAGFVQFMIGHGDRAAIQAVATELDEVLRRMRPDVIGGIVAWPGDGSFIQVVYFTSEAEARANESAGPATDEDKAAMERMGSLMTVDRFIDLNEPWLYGPR